MEYSHHSLVSRPRPVFCRLQYGKAVEDLGKCFYCNKQPPFFNLGLVSNINHPPRWKLRSEVLYQANLIPTQPGNEANIKLAQQFILCVCITLLSLPGQRW